MPEGVGYGPQNTASTGLSLNIIGNHAYAFSGKVTDATSGAANTILLDFTTGGSYFLGMLNFTDDHVAADNIFFSVTLNGSIVVDLAYKSGAAGNDSLNPWEILIPPFSNVQVKFGATSSVDGTAWLVGRIYGKIK
jgi:hypothetical protein